MQITHHVIQIGLTGVNLLYLCDIPFGQLKCDHDCLLTYRPFVSHAIMFSLGYFIFDAFLLVFYFDDGSKTTKQLLIHHSLCTMVFMCCLVGGKHLPGLSHTVMLCEISNIFLNMREFFGKDAPGMRPAVNNLLLFVAYTIFRVLYFPLMFSAHFRST